MSSFLVPDIHLSIIAQGAVQQGVITFDEADDLWIRMKFDNLYALHVRYKDPDPLETEIKSNRSTVEAPLSLSAIKSACQCWQYQCAEWEDYYLTTAYNKVESVLETMPDVTGRKPLQPVRWACSHEPRHLAWDDHCSHCR